MTPYFAYNASSRGWMLILVSVLSLISLAYFVSSSFISLVQVIFPYRGPSSKPISWVDMANPSLGQMSSSSRIAPPNLFPHVLSGIWAGSWKTPVLVKSSSNGQSPNSTSPALISLHVFSTTSEMSRNKRQAIREFSPLDAVPKKYRHLIDFQFIIGYPPITTQRSRLEEIEISNEMEQYRDVTRLQGLKDGENMNEGKSYDWIRWVATRQRESLWVFKCDDDVCLLPSIPP